MHVDFDIETDDSSLIWRQGPEFFRVAGYATGPGVRLTTDPHELIDVLRAGSTVTGHNILGFDLLVLAKNYGLDIMDLARRDAIRDTMLIAFLDDPPPARMNTGQINKHYSLARVSDRLFSGEHKYTDVTKRLVKEYGGWGNIPPLEPRFAAYVDQDVVLTGAVGDRFCGPERGLWDYARREHMIGAICAQITLNGFRVDRDEVLERVAAGQAKREQIIDRLVNEYGLPTTRKDGSPSSAPQNTQAGRAAIKKAFEAAGAKFMPKTDKGAWATGREAMDRMAAHYGTPRGGLAPLAQREIAELCETIQALNGVRTVYETTAAHMVEDSDGTWRVHPNISGRQASGRFSFSKPGLTVLGKRSGRHTEREVFLPEPGHVVVTVDLSQIDARAVAALSQDPAYMKMFEPGRDLHTEVAKRVFGSEEFREAVKPLNHGINYGLGLKAAINTLGIKPTIAKQFYDQMAKQFPRVQEWKREVAEVADGGHLLDNGFGRKMRCDRGRTYTQAPALMGQGGARDLLCEGLLRLERKAPEILPLLRGIIHDEVVLSAPAEDAREIGETVREALSFDWAPPKQSNARPVPIVAGKPEYGSTWSECYEKD